MCCGRLSYRLQEAMPGGFASFSRWFSSFCLREASCSETHKQNRLSVATMVLLGTRGPLLYQVIRGAYSDSETRCTRHAEPTHVFETHLEPKCRRTGLARQGRSRGRDSIGPETLKLFVISDNWRQTLLLSSRWLT